MTQSDLLKPLVDAIETVKQRIQEHGASLRENETRTRIALIDPILQALGWDVSDPSMVTLEYDVSGRRADYALLKSEGKPAATIEAKRLGQDLQQHRMQMLNYANASGVDYAGLTDGNHWELYDVFKRGELSERQLLSVSIASMSAHEAALKLLTLWRPNIAEGQPVEAEEPIAGLPTPDDPPTPEPDETNIEAIKERQREAGLKAAQTRRQRNPEREALEAAVYADWQAGMSYRAIAKKHGLHPGGGSTWSMVKRIREREGS